MLGKHCIVQNGTYPIHHFSIVSANADPHIATKDCVLKKWHVDPPAKQHKQYES